MSAEKNISINAAIGANREADRKDKSPLGIIMTALGNLKDRVEDEDAFGQTREISIRRVEQAEDAIINHRLDGSDDNVFVFKEVPVFLGEQFLIEIGVLKEGQTFAWMRENTRIWKNYGRGEFFGKGEPIGWTTVEGNGGVGAFPLDNGLGIVVIEKSLEDNSSSFLSIYIKD